MGHAMHMTNLRKVGGSVMMAVPPALLDLLQIGAGAKVGLAVDNGRMIVDPKPRPRYTLEELQVVRRRDRDNRRGSRLAR